MLEKYSFSLYNPLLEVKYTNDKRTFHVRNLFGGAPLDIVAVNFGASYSQIISYFGIPMRAGLRTVPGHHVFCVCVCVCVCV